MTVYKYTYIHMPGMEQHSIEKRHVCLYWFFLFEIIVDKESYFPFVVKFNKAVLPDWEWS